MKIFILFIFILTSAQIRLPNPLSMICPICHWGRGMS
jgi:hypothetical protein